MQQPPHFAEHDGLEDLPVRVRRRLPTTLGISAARYRWDGTGTGWQTADRSGIGALPRPTADSNAVVRIFSAQTVRWRGIFPTHFWIVLKPKGALSYGRYDYTAWGDPIRVNGFEPDGRWFGLYQRSSLPLRERLLKSSSLGCRWRSVITRGASKGITGRGRDRTPTCLSPR